MLICSDWRTRYFAPCYAFSCCWKDSFCNGFFVTVFSGHLEKIHHFQKMLEGFHFENQQREGVSVCAELQQHRCREQRKLLPASTVLGSPAPVSAPVPSPVPAPWFLCCLVSAALGEGLCYRTKAMHRADPRTGGIHSIQVRARTEKCKWKHQPYSPEVCPLSHDTDWTSDDCSRGFWAESLSQLIQVAELGNSNLKAMLFLQKHFYFNSNREYFYKFCILSPCNTWTI